MNLNSFSVPLALLASSALLAVTASAAPHPLKLRSEILKGARIGGQSPQPDKANTNYEWIDIRISGGHWLSVFAITESRIASGGYLDEQGRSHSFWWANGQTFLVPDYPGALHTSVGAINNAGRLFGNWGSDEVQHAGYFDLSSHRWVALPDIPGYMINLGARMTESGRATGFACQGTFSNSFPCIPWVWNGKGYQFISVPGAVSAFSFTINNPGQVAGYWFDSNFSVRGFAYRQGVVNEITAFDINGNPIGVQVFDLNNDGAMLVNGPFEPANSNWVPAILNRGSQTILPRYPGVLATFYQGMNERGDLGGLWYDDPAFTDFFGLIALRK